MTKQPEYILEENLVIQLTELGYKKVAVKDEADLIDNLKIQLEKHNGITLTNYEFKQVLNHLGKGNIFEKAKTLRDKVAYTKDNGDTAYLELINQVHWCKNQYQVTHQITMDGMYKNRYDVTILVNGLPLAQIELKRRGLELKEAFNQTNRYEKHSYQSGNGLFGYVQVFIISNGVNTKYYANAPVAARSFKQTFFWADTLNNKISQLSAFANIFLEPCQLSKMITKYIVLNESAKLLMVLRPYQYYAVEAIVERVKTTTKFGYIWHTTGSGKTLTSFKASQILTNLDEVHKVVFVVDRKDLDYQTIKEFNSFSDGSVDGTTNTHSLVKQFSNDTKLIVTTIQKLNTAVLKQSHLTHMDKLKDKRIVFIFDECHRSQFGDTHKRIKEYFSNAQMFGFTGTPIFADNAAKNEYGKRTTKDLFEDCLHKYVITDAIRDQNVLKFSIEYIRTFKSKDGIEDINIEDINRAEVMEAPQRLNAVTDYIIANHSRKTHNKAFTAMFCVQDVKTLTKYYDLFRAKKAEGRHDLKIATIFSYAANPDMDESDDNGFIEEENLTFLGEPELQYGMHPREKLDSYMADYNGMFSTNYTTNEFYPYYNDIARRVKNKQVDILLVVNMFLTGFDSKLLNTIFVDKNLKYHGLIQAYSRTNRILNELKSQGNVVCFRNLKEATDEAITLFSNKEAIEEIILKPYDNYVEAFAKAVDNLLEITPTVDSVNDLPSEDEIVEFVKAFRELMRLKNVLGTFTEFTFEDLPITEQDFEDYKSKYLDIRDIVKNEKEKVSILNDIDFELELIHRDEVNVVYILNLLLKLKNATTKAEREKQEKVISDIMAADIQLRSKKELIEKFIEQNLPLITDNATLTDEFERFWNIEKLRAIEQIATDENLSFDKLQVLVGNYLFTQKVPLREDIIAVMNARPGLKDRAIITERILGKIIEFVEKFVDGM